MAVPLTELFESLPHVALGGELPSFSTVVIGGGPHRLGKDATGAPALLVPLGAPAAGPPVELDHIAVQHGVRCRLWRAGGEPEAGA